MVEEEDRPSPCRIGLCTVFHGRIWVERRENLVTIIFIIVERSMMFVADVEIGLVAVVEKASGRCSVVVRAAQQILVDRGAFLPRGRAVRILHAQLGVIEA